MKFQTNVVPHSKKIRLITIIGAQAEILSLHKWQKRVDCEHRNGCRMDAMDLI